MTRGGGAGWGGEDAGNNSDGGRREGLVLGKGVGDEVGANGRQEEGQEKEGQGHVSEAKDDSRDRGEEETRSEQGDSLQRGVEEKGAEWHEGHDEASAAREDTVEVEREDGVWGKPEC